MDANLLRTFREVAGQGSITAAARTLGYTQSAVSRQISALEASLEVRLFDRVARGVQLTEYGRSLLPHAQSLLERIDGARRDLEALGRLERGRLRVGAFPTAVAALIPRAMAAFRAEHPHVSLSLLEGTTPRQLDRVRARDVDLAVVSAFPGQELDVDRIELSRLLDDPMLVAFPRSHPLAQRRRVRPAELNDESWIAADTSSDDHLLGPASVELASRPRVDFVANGWTEKLGLVAAGLGITVVPSLAAEAARPDIALARLAAGDGPPRRVYAATLEGVARSPATDAFIHVLEETASRLTLTPKRLPEPRSGPRGRPPASPAAPGGSPEPGRP